MQLFVKDLEGKTVTLGVDHADTVSTVKGMVEARRGIPVAEQRLVWGGRSMADERTLAECDIPADATLQVLLRLEGGAIEPTLQALARKYNCEKMVCRKCYARMHPKAQNCRKKKCGHTNQLRKKKEAKGK